MKGKSAKKTMGVLRQRWDVMEDGNKKIIMHANLMEVQGDAVDPKVVDCADDEYQDLSIRFVVWADGHTLSYTRYERPYDVDLRRCRAMLKKLQAVERALEKFKEQLGEAGDPTEQFLRMVNAVGATRIVECADEQTLKLGGSRYRVWSLSDGAGRLRRDIAEVLARWAAEAQAAIPA